MHIWYKKINRIQNPKKKKIKKKQKKNGKWKLKNHRNKVRIYFSKEDKLSKFAIFEEYYEVCAGDEFFQLDERRRKKTC